MSNDQIKIKKEPNSSNTVCCSDGEHYPYGTSLSFENELVEQLGIESLIVGDIVEVKAYAFVNGKSEYSSTDNDGDKNISIQLTSVSVRRESDDKASQLYGPDS